LTNRKKAAFAAVAIALLFGTLELLARGVYWARSLRAGPGAESAITHRFHPLRYELVPGSRLPANGPVARINNVGLRGADAEAPKRRTRVLCVGDSVTFGYAPGVTDEATYPAWLGRDLQQTHPGQFEVLNGGMPSFGSLDCLDFFLYKGVELRPDVVVILVGWNDSFLCHDLDSPPARPWDAVKEASALLRLVGELARRLAGAPRPDPARLRAELKRIPTPTDHLSEQVFERTERVIEDLVRSCRAHDAEPVLVTLPSLAKPRWTGVDSLTDQEIERMVPHLIGGNLSPRGWYVFVSRTNRSIESVARRQQVPLVDGASIGEPDLFVDVNHLNARGNEVLARRVAAAIERIAPRGG
jgi:lysophospholipase L1-like esterase